MGADETFQDSKTEFDGDKKPLESYNTGELEPGEDDNLSSIEQVNHKKPLESYNTGQLEPGEDDNLSSIEQVNHKKPLESYNTGQLEPGEDDNLSCIEQVNLTVPITDDPSLPVLTFRCWVLGILSCIALAFFNQFFSYRQEPLTVSPLTVQIVSMPLGKLMAAVLPTKRFLKGSRFEFTFNPGPFNMKEHVLITIFANCGYNTPYAISIVTILKVFYKKKISFIVSLLITVTTQMIGYGWAGMFRNYLVKPGAMWWPQNLVQVALFRTLHEKGRRPKRGFTRLQFFLIGMASSFAWYLMPGFFFPVLTSLSWVCWVFPNNVLAHQMGSGLQGLGIGAIAMDWSAISNQWLISPLATPWFAIANIAVGFFIIMYVITPIAYWNNIYNARTFPIYGPGLFSSDGTGYDVDNIINHSTFTLNTTAYDAYGDGKLHITAFFAFAYGIGFATLTATLSHVALFHGRNIWRIITQSAKSTKVDVHTRLMKVYRETPVWWFQVLFILTLAISIIGTEVFRDQLQLPWWGILLACALAFFFTLPIGIIDATTNQVPGLNIITEYMMGYIYPGHPVANVSFKTYGYVSMLQATTFLQDMKLSYYMKVPPISLFIVQLVGTLVSAVSCLATAWYLIGSVKNICFPGTSGSLWTCPNDAVFFDASVIWGLAGPKRIFGSLGLYQQANWGFLVGFLAPIPGWICTKIWPKVGFFRAINMPILIGAVGIMPPASAVNFTTWAIAGFVFNFLIYRRHKGWWSRYNYVLSASLDAGVAFMGVAIYFVLGLGNVSINWWGTPPSSYADHCYLASCPTRSPNQTLFNNFLGSGKNCY